MALVDNDVAFSVDFDLTATTPQLVLTDDTDYAGEGIATSAVVGVIKVVDPTGSTHYNNTDYGDPDVDCDVSLDSSKTITIPLDANNEVVSGTYAITYTVQDSTGSPYTVTKTKSFTWNYESPTVLVGFDYDCLTPYMDLTDDTDYDILDASGTEVTPTITRSWLIEFPNTKAASITKTTQDVRLTSFYTGVHQATLTTSLVYDFGNGWTITDSVVAYKDKLEVVCATSLCNFYCGIKKRQEKYESLKATKPTAAKEYKDEFLYAMSLLTLIRRAYSCGKTADVTTLSAQLEALVSCDCGCDGEGPVEVSSISSVYAAFNSWLNGSGAPDDANGADGDFYLDTTNQDVYKKVNGSWVFQFSFAAWLTGTGIPSGALGQIGDWYVSTDEFTFYKKTGASTWTEQFDLVNTLNGSGAPGTGLGFEGDFYWDYTNYTFHEKTGVATWTERFHLTQWLNGSGAPASGLGAVGDWYIDTANDNFYEKTAAATWTLRFNVTGATGANGSDGTTTRKFFNGNGSDPGVQANTYQSFGQTASLAHGNFGSGSKMRIIGYTDASVTGAGLKLVDTTNSVDIFEVNSLGGNILIDLEIEIRSIDATSYSVLVIDRTNPLGGPFALPIANAIAGSVRHVKDLTVTSATASNTFDIQGKGDATNFIYLHMWIADQYLAP